MRGLCGESQHRGSHQRPAMNGLCVSCGKPRPFFHLNICQSCWSLLQMQSRPKFVRPPVRVERR